ncbi:MAG: malto-oligosyltrehalose synthase [Deltaproteobacteria bacterium]|nr:malto-oligosyltrehalose synthase [Deltaproteobacteria bacterium]
MRIPTATYRIQFNPSFGFDRARRIVSYMADLGVSDLYASPVFRARRGSLHGYDIVDPNRLNPELGSLSDFHRLADELKHNNMGWLQDVVPNHMAFDQENRMLMDVIENGEASEFFRFFDIDWDHPCRDLKGRLLAPFLAGSYQDCLNEGEIKLTYGPSGLAAKYSHLVLPLKIESYGRFFTHRLEKLGRSLGADHPDFIKFLGVVYLVKSLPAGERTGERSEQVRLVKTTLWDLYRRNGEIKRFVDENLCLFNDGNAKPGATDPLNRLLSEQRFRLAFWKVATEEINYRRFFNINELICLRMEEQAVFTHTHSLIFRLIDEGRITGLRIDHVDGLYHPSGYLRRLREKAGDTYILVEKILDLDEEIPRSWPVQGTTGYDFLNYVNGLFCKKEGEKELTRVYRSFAGFRASPEGLVCDKKRLILGKHMAGDIDNLARLVEGTRAWDRYGSDITPYGLKRALVEVMCHFPVYRTYMNGETITQRDRSFMKAAIEGAKRESPGLLNELLLLERLLLLDFTPSLSEAERRQWIHFVMRFQQFTAPLMAKGFEDTTLYVYNRLISCNEVGGNPWRFGLSVQEFHRFNEKRARLWPHSMSATSTHDTKRGEDARARIDVLAEIPREWERRLRIWSRINRDKKRRVRGISVPDRNDEYFFYQALIGAFPFHERDLPLFIRRIKAYVVKAVREAKIHTAWLRPDLEYEKAYLSFIEVILGATGDGAFLDEFLPFQRMVARYGVFNSLSQTLVKITSPGVPDFYQGSELWDLSLVDPDNRRPVDFDIRKRFLKEIREECHRDIPGLAARLLQAREDGRVKLFLIHRALQARNAHPSVFAQGAYLPLEASGRFKDHVVAFARKHGSRWSLTVVPRFLTSLVPDGAYPFGREVWYDTEISLPPPSPRRWRDVILDRAVKREGAFSIGDLLGDFPVCLLVNEGSP